MQSALEAAKQSQAARQRGASNADEAMAARLAAGKKHRQSKASPPESLVQPIPPAQRPVVVEAGATTATTIAAQAIEAAAAAAQQSGEPFDITEHMRALTQAEAGRFLQQQLQQNMAEAMMLEKLRRGRGLSKQQQEELNAKQAQLDASADQLQSMLGEVMAHEQQRARGVRQASDAATADMQRKLARRGNRRRFAKMLAELRQRVGLQQVSEADGNAGRDRKGGSGARMRSLAQLDGAALAPALLAEMREYMRDRVEELSAEYLPDEQQREQQEAASEKEQKRCQARLRALGLKMGLVEQLGLQDEAAAARALAADISSCDVEARMLHRLAQDPSSGFTTEQAQRLARRQAVSDSNRDTCCELLARLVCGQPHGALNAEQRDALEQLVAEACAQQQEQQEQQEQADSMLLGGGLTAEAVMRSLQSSASGEGMRGPSMAGVEQADVETMPAVTLDQDLRAALNSKQQVSDETLDNMEAVQLKLLQVGGLEGHVCV